MLRVSSVFQRATHHGANLAHQGEFDGERLIKPSIRLLPSSLQCLLIKSAGKGRNINRMTTLTRIRRCSRK